MKIKRFTAPDMRQALRLVREEQGEQAVILSSQRIAQGVEVVAATDYDEALMQTALRTEAAAAQAAARSQAPSPSTLAPMPGASAIELRPATLAHAATAAAFAPPAHAALANTLPHAARPAAATSRPPAAAAAGTAGSHAAVRDEAADSVLHVPAARQAAAANDASRDTRPALALVDTPTPDPSVSELRRDLASMRELIEREVGRFADERLRGVPVRAMVLDELLDYGCDPEMSRAIATAIPADADPGRARGMLLALLAKSLLPAPKEPIFEGGVIALVGPTGVGKTTTLAKLAARYAKARSPRDVALVSADTYRMGAREQLAHYGRLLGMPVFEAGGGDGLARTLDRLSDYPLVLVDTAGFGQRDEALAAQFAWHDAPRPVRSLLVLPANAQPRDLEEVIARFRIAQPEAAILSKIDETGQLGSALSVISRQRLPLAYVTDGQRVPEDLQCAEGHRLVLRLGELRRAATQGISKENSNVA